MVMNGAASAVFWHRAEREADLYQLRVAGSEGFISAILGTNLLSLATQRAVVELSRMWRQRRLADDFPGLVVSIRHRYLPPRKPA